MGLMGTAGMLSVFFVLPQMGKVYDHYKALGGEVVASQMSFRVVGGTPSRAAVLFLERYGFYDRSPRRLQTGAAHACGKD